MSRKNKLADLNLFPAGRDMKQPLVSVIMPLYNKEYQVLRSIESVCEQSINDFELIVINDGSTDSGPDLLRSFPDKRIKVFDQKNKGVSAARNRGVQEAQADLVAFLDADDEWQPTFLETILKLKQEYPTASVFATGYSYLEQDGSRRQPIINGLPAASWSGILDNYFQVAAQSDPPLWSSAIAVTKEALTAINGFPVGIKSGEDLLTWARLAVKYKIAYDTSHLALFRQRASTHEAPTRTPERPDIVAAELGKLLQARETSHKKDLRHYRAWWYKNRANMHLRLQQRPLAFKEVIRMGFYHLDSKFFMYAICLLLPFPLLQQLIWTHKNNS